MAHVINEDELFYDSAKGLEAYGVSPYRAGVLAKTNLLFIAEEMYEAQDSTLQRIARQEKRRLENES